jgi:hypothetical protein
MNTPGDYFGIAILAATLLLIIAVLWRVWSKSKFRKTWQHIKALKQQIRERHPDIDLSAINSDAQDFAQLRQIYPERN